MENVEDLIPLAPMQHVMLLRALSTGGQESLFQQFRFELRGALQPESFYAAWSRAVERHTSLRTAFLWRGLQQPLQVVRKEAAIPYRYVDCGENSDLARGQGLGFKQGSRSETLAAFLEEDRAAGFDLTAAPLTRLALFRWSDDEWTFVWTSHHLVIDRWSIAPLLDDVWREYDRAVGHVDALAAGRSRYRDYISWVEKQDPSAAIRHFGERLSGVEGAVRVLTESARSSAASAANDGGERTAEFDLDPARCARLRAAAQSSRVTPGAMVQAAWALTMAELTAAGDVCFGLTVAGRPPGVPGIERMVGSFIGNVPVRVRFTPEMTASSLCQQLLREGQARAPFEYLAPTEIHRITRLPQGEPLFDTLLLWLSGAEARDPAGLDVTAVPGEAATAWPVTVSVLESGGALEVTVRLAQEARLRGELSALDVAHGLERALELLVQLLDAAPDVPIRDHFRLGEPPEAPAPLPLTPAAPIGAADKTGTEFDPGGREFDDPEMMQELLFDECKALLAADAPLDPEQGFFEQGGSSMLAAQLHARLEALTGRALPLLELFEAPTLQGMADELTSQSWPILGGALRAIREEGTRPPLFCVSSPEVNSLGYVTLSRELDPDQPVYVTQGRPSGADAVFRMAVSDIPRLAKDSVDAIQERFPNGPYRFFGMCDGALVAFEMARLLEERGAEVDFLCLLNTYALGTLRRRYKIKRVATRVGYYRRRVGQVLVQKLGRGPGASAGKAPSPGKAEEVSSAAPTGGAARAEPAPSLADRLAVINGEWFRFDRRGNRPKAPTYRGRITVLRNTAQPYWRVRDKALGWGAYSDDVEVVDLQVQREAVQGRERRGQQDAHMALLRAPDIQYVVRALEERLERLDARATGGVQ